MKILVVDDKEEPRYFLESLLKGNGYDVETAIHGVQALEKLKTEPFELIISDILMPEMDGFQLCHNIRMDKTFRNVPFIFYTATYTGPQDEEFAMKIGANRFIRKPCEPDELLKVVQDVMKQAGDSNVTVRKKPLKEEEVLKLYNERLVRKLEQKMLTLETEVRKRESAEKELKDTARRLQLALRAANIGLWDWDLKTNDVWYSPEWKRQIGYEDHEITNQYEEWESRLHPEDRERVLQKAESYLKDPRMPYHTEFRLRHKNGSYRWIEVLGEAIEGFNGGTKRFLGCHIDITHHKEITEALENEKRRFQALIDEAPFGVVLFEKDNRFIYLNPTFTDIFGYTLDDIPTRDIWFEKAHPDPDYRQEVISMWRQAEEKVDSGMVRSRVIMVRCKDGKDKMVQIRTAFMATGNQVITYEDVTEQEQLEDKLRHAQKMEAIGALAGGIAHDFNNILTAIIGYADLARLHLPDNSPAEMNLKEVLIAGNRAKKLVDHILAFSRQTEHEMIPIDLELIVKEVLSLLRASLPSTIEIRLDVNPIGTIFGDPTQIHQVIMNLCTNAYHAMQETGGVLEIGLKQVALGEEVIEYYPGLLPGSFVLLVVSDTGCGMSPELMNRIFEPYFTTKREGEGTGFGLAVVHGIVKSHGGTIAVYSELGKGSAFHVYLPLSDSIQGKQELFDEAPLPRGNERILFVDDEVSLADLGKRMLETLGYQVVSQTRSMAALELFRGNPDAFDLVITDMTMPEMTGAELAVKLLKIRRDIPVILTTGFSQNISEIKAKKVGIREFVMKPFIKSELAKIIRRVIDNP